MRFAYIDSQGNEVPIPGVDALALRIELGAVGPETQLYDASADRWGPAHTHEIFHTLSREVEGEGFVAPPPPIPPADGSASGRTDGGDVEEVETGFDFTGDIELVKEGGGDDDRASPAPDAPPASARPEEEELDLGLDLTLADEGSDSDAFDFGGIDPVDTEPGEAEHDEPEARDEAAAPDHGMTLEEPLGGEMDFSPLEDDMGGGLELERPMSEFTPETMPGWIEQEGPGGGGSGPEEPMELSRRSEEDVPSPRSARADSSEGRGALDRPRRERPKPKNRPSPPRRPRKPVPMGSVVVVLLLAALGVGGWYGWTAYQARESHQRVASLPEVRIPTIPANLRPRMNELGRAALGGTIAQFESELASSHLPAEPRSDWLAGVYLANASRYPDVKRYWMAIDSFVDHVRETDTRTFHEQYVAALDRAGIEGDTARMLLERADSGFLATRKARFEAYNQMDDLVNAALDLHQFLLDNEAAISYEPAAGGVSRDPVLEAVPSSEALGDRMWNMVDRITNALDALGTLNKVTTDRLFAVLFQRVRTAGFK